MKRRAGDEAPQEASFATVKIPAKTMIYLECSNAEEWARVVTGLGSLMPISFALRAPWPVNESARVVECVLTRAVTVAVLPSHEFAPAHATLDAHALDGFQDESTQRITLFDEEAVNLVDDDKRPGLTQAFISDMFNAMSMHGAQAHPEL
mmetsp:Transcript_23933/g.70502  ORF Transcript_23933/g.70502 Transcript_23933/m.70502 type:complete len:150 (-) Transcript_23933:159-608(-)